MLYHDVPYYHNMLYYNYFSRDVRSWSRPPREGRERDAWTSPGPTLREPQGVPACGLPEHQVRGWKSSFLPLDCTAKALAECFRPRTPV